LVQDRWEDAMKLIRREFLLWAGAAASASTVPAAWAQAGPKLTQVLRKDLQGQGEKVQESVVSVVEFGPGSAAPLHMHPGAQEILYALEGSLVVEMEGQAAATIKAGEAAVIPADVAHLARNESTSVSAKALVVHSRSDKGKPLVVAVKV
jgi:quercetin dioxygenase-like cupin family protein